MEKKVLVVDDSALMRRVISDIINSDSRFHVEDTASNGVDALDKLTRRKSDFDAMVLDVNMPKMSGLELLKEMQKLRVRNIRVMMFSSTTAQGTRETIEALELGAIDFIRKPDSLSTIKQDSFKEEFLKTLGVVSGARLVGSSSKGKDKEDAGKGLKPGKNGFTPHANAPIVLRKPQPKVFGEKCVAIACSTGGPKALQKVIPFLPANLNAPVLLVQHMPKGFTKPLADRLNSLSKINVKEAEDGEPLKKGTVYIAAGGKHMKVGKSGANMRIYYTDEPSREGVKPAANYMYESLEESPYAEICCAVLTGMGADGAAGIVNLETKKKIYVIAQDEPTSAVYGMPKAVAQTGLVSEILPLEKVADAITNHVGVK